MKNTENKKSILIFLFIIILSLTSIHAQEDNLNSNVDTNASIDDMISNEIDFEEINIDLENNENSETIYITEDNYRDYEGYEFEDNTTIIINDSLENFELYIENKTNINIFGKENVSLHNSVITIYMGNATISNLTFTQEDNSDYLSSVEIITDNCTLENLNFIDNRSSLTRGTYNVVKLVGDNNKIINSNFDSILPAVRVRWITYFDETKSVVLYMNGNNNTALNNKFNIQESERELPYGIITGISSYGNNSTIANNNIYMNGTLYLYGIRVVYHDNNITNNTIRVYSQRYANGISLDGESSNNIVDNNDIDLKTQNITIDEQLLTDAGYGIIITEIRYKGGQYRSTNTKTINNIITNNKISGNSSHMYGIEQFGGTNTEISNNVINVTGYMPMAIGVIGNNTQITNNILIAQGQTREIGDSADYIKPRTSAITDTYGSNTVISGNYIYVENGTIAGLDAAKNVTFINNLLNSNSEDNIKLRGYSDYDIDDDTVHSINVNSYSNEIDKELAEELGSDYMSDNPPEDDSSYDTGSSDDETSDYSDENPNQNGSNDDITHDDITIITDDDSTDNREDNPIVITNDTDTNNNDTNTHEDTIPDKNKNTQTSNDTENKTENIPQTDDALNSTPIQNNTTKTDNIENTTIPPLHTNNTNNTINQSIPNQSVLVQNSSTNIGNEASDTSTAEPLEKSEVYEVQPESTKDNNKNENKNKNMPELELTSTVGKASKVFEVTPKMIEKTITLENLKYALIFILIIFASLICGYRKNEFR